MRLVNLTKDLHLTRSRQIAGVLLNHGWEYLTTGREDLAKPQVHTSRNIHTRAEHLRAALEELGTTFIKLGQILSTRADLLPPDYLAELTKLQDSTTPVPFPEIQQTIINELRRPIAEVFAYLNPEPLATGSIGQAHEAVLLDGTEVVVKVRRPGVVEQVNEDLEILKELGSTASRHSAFADQYDLSGLVEEFAGTLRAELDYVREAHNAERFAVNFAHDSALHIPKIFWNTTTSKVLTMERIRGVKINDLSALKVQGTDNRWLAEYATNIVMKMVCEDGFFHADPHPGNFFIEHDGTIGLIDFGMVGILHEGTQERLADLLVAIDHQDANRLVDVFLDLGVTQRRINRTLFRRDIEHLLSTYLGLPLRELKVTALLNQVFAVMRRHHLHLPPNLALLLKTVIMIEGLGVNLDPGFHMTSALAPYARRLVLRQFSPLKWMNTLSRAGLDFARLGSEAPQQLRRIVNAVEDGNLEIGIRPEGFNPLINRFETIANRIVLGVIAAAFINGLAVLVSVYKPPAWERWAWVVFAFGFLCALLLGAYLAVAILGSKHNEH